MDNRDRNVRCPFYRPGTHHTTKNKRLIGQRKRTINCKGAIAYHSVRFQTVEERAEYSKRYCKMNCGACPIYNCIEQMNEEQG